ncbi:hypothetical protein V3C99_009027, partial [Haemonchus contortus]
MCLCIYVYACMYMCVCMNECMYLCGLCVHKEELQSDDDFEVPVDPQDSELDDEDSDGPLKTYELLTRARSLAYASEFN